MEKAQTEAVIRQHILHQFDTLVAGHNEAARVTREAANLSPEDLEVIREMGRA